MMGARPPARRSSATPARGWWTSSWSSSPPIPGAPAGALRRDRLRAGRMTEREALEAMGIRGRRGRPPRRRATSSATTPRKLAARGAGPGRARAGRRPPGGDAFRPRSRWPPAHRRRARRRQGDAHALRPAQGAPRGRRPAAPRLGGRRGPRRRLRAHPGRRRPRRRAGAGGDPAATTSSWVAPGRAARHRPRARPGRAAASDGRRRPCWSSPATCRWSRRRRSSRSRPMRRRAGAPWPSPSSTSPARSAGCSPAATARCDRIVEAADATPEELAVRRVNAGLYALPAPEIFDYLRRPAHRQRPGRALPDRRRDRRRGRGPAGRARPAAPTRPRRSGVNTRAELARVHRRLLDRHLRSADGRRA